jgi:uroporphyrinogen III methyltransferase / synthase
MGKVFLVGAGPGDLKLITLKGLELIQTADVIIYDNLINKELLNFARRSAELIYVGKAASQHELPQPDINTLLVDKAKAVNAVVRLKGGDPFIFGRGGEEAEHLIKYGIDFEIVPGVTSAISVPAYAGIPLTHRDCASTVAFITGHEDERKKKSTIRWHELANGPDTLVFLMGIKNLRTIKERLIKEGRAPHTPACLITSGTLPEQRVASGPLDKIDAIAQQQSIKPPGIFIVGDVVRLRGKLAWYEKKPFFGKTIVITRAATQSKKFGELLMDKGARVVYIPTIEITTIEPNKKLQKAINNISDYFVIIFTSVNSVSIFFNNLMESGKDTRSLRDIKIIPIGQATATLLEMRGITPDFIPQSYTSEGIVEVVKKLKIKGNRFLLPRAEVGRDVLIEFIKKQGGICDVIPIYKTTLPKKRVPLTEEPDIITFTSSSTVDNFIAIYGKQILKKPLIASIGPITSKTLQSHNVSTDIEAARYDITGLIQAMETYFVKEHSED